MKKPSKKKGLSRNNPVKSRRKRTSKVKTSILETKYLEALKTAVADGQISLKSSTEDIYQASNMLHTKENNRNLSTKEVIAALELKVKLKEGHPFYKAIHAGKVAFILELNSDVYPYSSLAIFAQEHEEYWSEILELANTFKGKKTHSSANDIKKAKNIVLDRYKNDRSDKSDGKGTPVSKPKSGNNGTGGNGTSSGNTNKGNVTTDTGTEDGDDDDNSVIDEKTIRASVYRIVKAFPKKKKTALNVFTRATPELLVEEINLMHECESIENGREIAIEALNLAISRPKKKSRGK